MSTEEYIQILKAHAEVQAPDFGDGESVLTLPYEPYNDVNTMDDAQIKADFHKLYGLMNGMPLRDMDKIICPVCTLYIICFPSQNRQSVEYGKDVE